MKNMKKAKSQKMNKQQVVQKAVIAPVVIAGLLVNTMSPTISLASPLLVEVQKSEVVVVYKNDSGKQKVLEKAIEVKDDLGTLKAISVVMTESAIRSLEKDPDIGYIERKLKEEVELLGTPGQWNVEAVNAPKAWEQGITGQGVKVAIIDSGIGVHADLPNVVQRLSFTQSTGAVADVAPYDNNGHGTHVAGIVGAKQGGATSGGLDFVGVAPNVSLYSLKVVDGTEGTVLDVIEAIDWAIANNMDVINLSLGLTSHVQLLQDAVDRAYQAGIVVVAAAGNDGNGTPVNYPAKYDSVIAVSSVDQSKTISSFSSTGAEVEFTAPGGAVKSTYMSGGTATYATVGGTSQASPHVAGFVALLMQKDPSKSANEIRTDLQKYVDDLGAEGRDELYGHGFINYLAFDETAPAEVTSLTATEKTQDSITVSWTNPADVDFAKAVILSNGEVVGETTDKTQNTFKIEQLQPETEYNIVVKTLDAKGNESVGATLVVTTEADAIAPAEVTDLAVTEATTDSATIGFTLPTDEDFAKANVYVDGVLNGETTTGSYQIQNLESSTDYSVIVKTVDEKGNESLGQEVVVSTQAEVDVTAPGEVAGLAISDVTPDSFLVTWVNPMDEDFLTAVIYQNGEQVASSEDGTFLFEGMEADTEYEIVVTTMDAEGNESVGQALTVKTAQRPDVTAPAEVTGLTTTDVTHNSITLSFAKPSDEDFSMSQIYVNGEFVGDTDGNEYVLTDLDPETEYDIVVTTIDTSLNESVGQNIQVTTKETPDTTAPAEVTTITPVDVTHDSITVSYVNPADEDFAKVNFYVNGEFAGESTSMTHTFDNLNPETAYDIEIKTVDVKGNESAGTSVRIYTEKEPDVTAPAEVTGLTATNVSSDGIEISFANPADEDFAKANIYVDGTFVGSTTSSGYAIDGLEAEKQYEITVKTEDVDGNESVGQVITVKTPDVTAPNEVTELQVSEVTGTSALVTFNNPANEDFAFANVFVNGELVGVTTEGSYVLTNLDSKTSYTVKVSTVDESGNESNGQTLNVQTLDVTAPNEVTGLVALDVTHESAKLSFANPADEDFEKANVYVNGELKGQTTSGTFELNGLTAETDYAIVVKTVDASGNESVGQSVSVQTKEIPDTTAPAEVTALGVTGSTPTSISISFAKPSDNDFAKTNLYLNGEFVASTTEGEYTFEGLESAKEYTIIAVTEDVKGNKSEGVTLTTSTKEIPDTFAPAEVTGFLATDVTFESMKLSFVNPSDEDFAKVNIYVNGELAGETTSGNYELNDLTAKTSYEVTIKTVDALGNESVGETINVTTKEAPDTTAPAEVTGLEGNATTNSATITFTNPSDEDFAKANVYVNGELHGETTSGTYALSDLTAETTYDIVVKTVDVKGNESAGTTISVVTEAEPVVEEPAEPIPTEPTEPSEPSEPTPTEPTEPEQPVDPEPTPEPVDHTAPAEATDALAKDITTTSAVISWTNPTDEDFAMTNIYVNGEKIQSVAKGEETVFEMTGLTAETSYEVMIKSVDGNGNESEGQVVVFSTEAEPVAEEPTPTDPEQPTEPTEPTEPSEPAEPNPTEPEQPVDPEPTPEPQPEPVDQTAPAEASDVQATDVTVESAVISWANPSDADFKATNIYVDGVLVKTVEKGSKPEFILEGLDSETAYKVVLKTVDANGNEAEGIELNITTLAVVVVEPTPTEPTPTEPTEPEQPEEPAPTEPTQPEEPTNPPTEPSQPEVPSEPTPTEPSEPAPTPVDPEPTQPEPSPVVDEPAPSEPVETVPTVPAEPTEEEAEKGFFEKLKDVVLNAVDAIVDFLTPDADGGEKKEVALEDFGLAYEFKNQLTPEQQEQINQYKASIRIQEVTAEGNVKFSELNNVSANQKIKLTLANAIDPSTLDLNDVFVRHNGEIVNDMVMIGSEDGKTITFIPSESFEPGKYSLFIDNKGLKSMDGAEVDNPVVVVFNLQ